MAARVVIVRPDDEHLVVEVDGIEVAYANHDEHGWSGMDAVEKTALAIAKAVGLDPSARLCVCGTRGCDQYLQHTTAFVGEARGRKGNIVRRRSRRRT